MSHFIFNMFKRCIQNTDDLVIELTVQDWNLTIVDYDVPLSSYDAYVLLWL